MDVPGTAGSSSRIALKYRFAVTFCFSLSVSFGMGSGIVRICHTQVFTYVSPLTSKESCVQFALNHFTNYGSRRGLTIRL